MAKADIRYLHVVDGYLRYRRRVPQDLQRIIGKREWNHALGLCTGQEAQAAKIVADYNLAYAALVSQERVKRITGVAYALAQSTDMIVDRHTESEKPSVKLSDAYAYDLETHGGLRDEKIFKFAFESVIKLMGDLDLMTMTPKDVQIWISKCEECGQKATTIKRRINALSSTVNRYFRDHEIEKRNPFSNTRIKDGVGTKTDRMPFNRQHLKRIDKYILNSPRTSDDIKRIIPLLKMTGARPLEIGGLDASDVLIDHEFPHLWIRNNPHRRIKTKGSERRIPLVGVALEAARAAKTTNPVGPIFTRTSHDTNSLSQRLNKLIRRSGVPKSTRLVAYSFRHTLEEALRSAGVREHTQKRIMGHADTSITGRYGAPAGMLEELRQALRSAEPLLGKVDASIYTQAELV